MHVQRDRARHGGRRGEVGSKPLPPPRQPGFWPPMSARFLPVLLVALAALPPAAAAEETVNFVSLDGHTNLTAHLSRPEGDAPRPALVLMHGCSGLLDGKGRIFAIYRAWARALVVQ